MNDHLQKIDQTLEGWLPPQNLLFEAARYALFGGGKRLRPLLTLATTSVLKGNTEAALAPACTIELIHTYSMIHDDLPCMDDDDFRRGKPTLHRKYSEGHAVITGDFLLTYAFEKLATAPYITAEQKEKMIALLAIRSGSQGMIGGQVSDLASEGQTLSINALRSLHKKKTGALIVASIEFGAIVAHASTDHLESLKCFGEALGLAFQVADDILDVTDSQAKHGRTIASDILNHKATYVSLLGLEQAIAFAHECRSEALNALSTLPYDTAPLAAIIHDVLYRIDLSCKKYISNTTL